MVCFFLCKRQAKIPSDLVKLSGFWHYRCFIGINVKTNEIAKSMGITHGTMQTYRKRLMEAGIIFSPRRGELEFVMPLLADYLKRRAGKNNLDQMSEWILEKIEQSGELPG